VNLPAWAGVPAVLLAVVALAPATLPSYEAYFYPAYHDAYAYFLDRPGTTIYALGPRPFFLLGRHLQHRVVYDLNPPPRLKDDPARFIHDIVRCVAPAFLILPEGAVAATAQAEEASLVVVERQPQYVILENSHRVGSCGTRYVMHP
jgi:hypothetical protein